MDTKILSHLKSYYNADTKHIYGTQSSEVLLSTMESSKSVWYEVLRNSSKDFDYVSSVQKGSIPLASYEEDPEWSYQQQLMLFVLNPQTGLKAVVPPLPLHTTKASMVTIFL